MDALDPTCALVYSPSVMTPKGSINNIIAGDTINYLVIPLNQDGTSHIMAGTSSYSLTANIGNPGTSPLIKSSNFTPSSSYGWYGQLNTNNTEFTASIVTNPTTLTISFVVASTSTGNTDTGSFYTISQTPVNVFNKVR